MGNRGVNVQSVEEIGRERKRKLSVCLPAMLACLSPSISFFSPSLSARGCVHSAVCFKVVLNVTDVYGQRAVCFVRAACKKAVV